MRLITWNVARRVTRLAEMASAIAEREPDVVCLQEVTARSGPLWRQALAAAGLPHALHSLDGADPARLPAAPRRAGVLIASRATPEPRPALAVPWPESALAARVEGVEVHNVHVPNAANGPIKPRTLAAVRAGLASRAGARILCGDLNTPRREHPDGATVSFARDTHERLRPERGTDWDEAELGVVPGLREIGFIDCFRALHGYGVKSPSWVFRHGGGWRLDHVFCSPELQPVLAEYLHDWRDRGLSDHSPLQVDFTPRRMS